MMSPDHHPLPAIPDIESQLLGAAMLHKGILADVMGNLSEDSLTDSKHRAVFSILRDFHLEGKEVDASLVLNRLCSKGAIETSDGAAYICNMLDVIPAPTMAKSWRQEIQKKHSARRLIKLTEELSRAAKSGDDPKWLFEEFNYRLNAENEASAGFACVFRMNSATIPAGKRPPFRWEKGQHSDLIAAGIPAKKAIA